MFGQQQRPSITQAIAQARSVAGNDPEGAVRRMAQQNPQVAQLLNGRTSRQACEELARQRGIDLGAIVGALNGGR